MTYIIDLDVAHAHQEVVLISISTIKMLTFYFHRKLKISQYSWRCDIFFCQFQSKFFRFCGKCMPHWCIMWSFSLGILWNVSMYIEDFFFCMLWTVHKNIMSTLENLILNSVTSGQALISWLYCLMADSLPDSSSFKFWSCNMFLSHLHQDVYPSTILFNNYLSRWRKQGFLILSNEIWQL